MKNMHTSFFGRGDNDGARHIVKCESLEIFQLVTDGSGAGVINDLHEEVHAVCGVNFISCTLQDYNNEHASIPGAAFLGIRTAMAIAKRAGVRWP